MFDLVGQVVLIFTLGWLRLHQSSVSKPGDRGDDPQLWARGEPLSNPHLLICRGIWFSWFLHHFMSFDTSHITPCRGWNDIESCKGELQILPWRLYGDWPALNHGGAWGEVPSWEWLSRLLRAWLWRKCWWRPCFTRCGCREVPCPNSECHSRLQLRCFSQR